MARQRSRWFAIGAVVLVPILIIGGWRLIYQSMSDGPGAAMAGLAFVLILGLSVLAIFAFEAAAAVAVEATPIVIFGAVTATAAILLAVGLTSSARETPTAKSEPRLAAPA